MPGFRELFEWPFCVLPGSVGGSGSFWPFAFTKAEAMFLGYIACEWRFDYNITHAITLVPLVTESFIGSITFAQQEDKTPPGISTTYNEREILCVDPLLPVDQFETYGIGASAVPGSPFAAFDWHFFGGLAYTVYKLLVSGGGTHYPELVLDISFNGITGNPQYRSYSTGLVDTGATLVFQGQSVPLYGGDANSSGTITITPTLFRACDFGTGPTYDTLTGAQLADPLRGA